MKTFQQITQLESNSLAILDSLNLAFRWKHKKAKNFADEYMSTVDSLCRSYKCEKLIIAGDMGSSSYRKELLPTYKGGRKEKYAEQTEQEAQEFKEFLQEVTDTLAKYKLDDNYPVLRFPGVEADDIAGFICKNRKKYGIEKIWLFSSDRDWSLLVDDYVSQFSYVTRKEITADTWNDHYDCDRDEYISIKCLMGDSGDSVPGVGGIGPKRALELVQAYGSAFDIAASIPIASKYKYIAALNEFGADNLLRNYKLMDLLTFCEEAIGPENCEIINETLKGYLN